LTGLRTNHEMAQRSNPALSKPVLGRSLPRLPNYLGREPSAFHPGQESFHSTKGRIHLRRPTLSFSFSLATRRRTIHLPSRRAILLGRWLRQGLPDRRDQDIYQVVREDGPRPRDQLYLALRLAAIEHHVETVSPCPVILDDILINADNGRATATLKVLSNLARRTQVLFFTHHRHLEGLGREAGAQIIDLNISPVITRA
jgi:hypothetical protein